MVTHPVYICQGHPAGLIPLEDIMKALLAQNKVEEETEPIYVTEYDEILKTVMRVCSWFVAVDKTEPPKIDGTASEKSPTKYFTKAMIEDEIISLELIKPFTCGINWKVVKELKYVLKCKETGRMYEIQVWADPAFVDAKTLRGQAVTDPKTGVQYLVGTSKDST